MLAFTSSPLPLSLHSKPSTIKFPSSNHKKLYRHSRLSSPVSIISCSTSAPSKSKPSSFPRSDLSQLQKRGVQTLRGLSDFAGMTLMLELCHRLTNISSPPSIAFISDAELLLGGLVGIWTAAVLAERIAFHSRSILSQSKNLPIDWDTNFIYDQSFDNDLDEINTTIAWLVAFDELEGFAAIELLRSLAKSKNIAVRLRLAHVLATCPVRTNVTLSIIFQLATTDTDSRVRHAAFTALHAYHKAGIIIDLKNQQTDDFVMTTTTNNNQSLVMMTSLSSSSDAAFIQDVALSSDTLNAFQIIFNRVLYHPAPVPLPFSSALLFSSSSSSSQNWFIHGLSTYFEQLRNSALANNPNLFSSPSHITSNHTTSFDTFESHSATTQRQLQLTSSSSSSSSSMSNFPNSWYSSNNDDDDEQVNVDKLRSAVPLVDSLVTEEIHGICALALLPAAYEVFSSIQPESFPFRFIGLGWLLAVGGLAAYPNSAKLWAAFTHAIDVSKRPRTTTTEKR